MVTKYIRYAIKQNREGKSPLYMVEDGGTKYMTDPEEYGMEIKLYKEYNTAKKVALKKSEIWKDLSVIDVIVNVDEYYY